MSQLKWITSLWLLFKQFPVPNKLLAFESILATFDYTVYRDCFDLKGYEKCLLHLNGNLLYLHLNSYHVLKAINCSFTVMNPNSFVFQYQKDN